jgi:hypothetical protein
LERTLISWTVPNLITIPLMAFAGFLLMGVVYQLVLRTGLIKSAEGGA